MKNIYVLTSLAYKDEDIKLRPVMQLDDLDIDRIKENYSLEEIELASNPDLVLKVDALHDAVDLLRDALSKLKKEGE